MGATAAGCFFASAAAFSASFLLFLLCLVLLLLLLRLLSFSPSLSSVSCLCRSWWKPSSSSPRSCLLCSPLPHSPQQRWHLHLTLRRRCLGRCRVEFALLRANLHQNVFLGQPPRRPRQPRPGRCPCPCGDKALHCDHWATSRRPPTQRTFSHLAIFSKCRRPPSSFGYDASLALAKRSYFGTNFASPFTPVAGFAGCRLALTHDLAPDLRSLSGGLLSPGCTWTLTLTGLRAFCPYN